MQQEKFVAPRPPIIFNFRPNFDQECRECGATPTVTVCGHMTPDTQLCGVHFFNDRMMTDWEKWNEREEDTE